MYTCHIIVILCCLCGVSLIIVGSFFLSEKYPEATAFVDECSIKNVSLKHYEYIEITLKLHFTWKHVYMNSTFLLINYNTKLRCPQNTTQILLDKSETIFCPIVYDFDCPKNQNRNNLLVVMGSIIFVFTIIIEMALMYYECYTKPTRRDYQSV